MCRCVLAPLEKELPSLKIFVAGPSKDLLRVRAAMENIRELGHDTYDWTQQLPKDPKSAPRSLLQREAVKDLAYVASSHGVIWLDSPRHSEGAPVEVGFALGKGIPVVSLSEEGGHSGARFYRHLVIDTEKMTQALEAIRALAVLHGRI